MASSSSTNLPAYPQPSQAPAYPGSPYVQPPSPTSTDSKATAKKLFSIGNPLPKAIEKDCQRAVTVLDDYLQTAQERALIPDSVLQSCKGLVFFTAVKAGYIWSVRAGSGIVVARLEDGSWSAPSSLVAFGVGYGAQVGLEFSDFVIILRDDNALNTFTTMGNVTVGGNLSVTLGPWGRNAELNIPATCALLYSLNRTKGIFAGLSIEGTVFLENRRANEKCHGKGATAKLLLGGHIRPAEGTLPLLSALSQRFNSSSAASNGGLPLYTNDKAPLLQGEPHSDAGPSTSLAPVYPHIEHQYQNQGQPGQYQRFVDQPLQPMDLKVHPEEDNRS